MRLNAYIHRQDLLNSSDIDDMYHLHANFYDNLCESTFLNDLDEKQWVILLRSGDGKIAGFTTIQVIDLDINGTGHRFLFSGDTIVDPGHWFESSLAGAFGHLMLWEIDNSDGRKLHWFLICKGFRTYRFLPVYFNEFYPRFDRPMPEGEASILQAIAQYKFPGSFEMGSGLIRLAGAKDRLCNQLCSVPESRTTNPHVAYFLQRNPHFNQGDELACLADISWENLRSSARRVLQRCEVEWCA